jgi:hypothetical protein
MLFDKVNEITYQQTLGTPYDSLNQIKKNLKEPLPRD